MLYILYIHVSGWSWHYHSVVICSQSSSSNQPVWILEPPAVGYLVSLQTKNCKNTEVISCIVIVRHYSF